ncbi:MAG: hypothetical protein KAH38_03710 [Candidatus Hydrogenedentes bacterium]|nr:hypothetical protein [Candidatus Hydrogenedentota bacterium]
MKNSSEENCCNKDIAIQNLKGLSDEQYQVLLSRWINTVDSFVGAVALDAGRSGLCEMLEIDAAAMESLLSEAHELLGEVRYNILSTATSGGPLGVLLEEEKKQPETNS